MSDLRGRRGVMRLLVAVALGACNQGEGGHGFASAGEGTADGGPGGDAGDAAGDADGSGSSADDGGGDDGPKLDVGAGGGGGDNCGDGPGGGGLAEVEFSNIWIANSPQGTVSKIDTVTGEELARYATGSDATTDPSRTTVNLDGDVAVLNRGAGGGVIKIAAENDRCIDRDGDGAIQTSSGPTDVLAWDVDECVVWSVPLWTGARAAAWDSGNDPEQADCEGTPGLWVSGMDAQMTVHVLHLDGDTGEIDGEATIPGWDGSSEWGGLYGGAVDKARNLWAIGKDNAALFRIEYETMAVTRWEGPADVVRFYGIAMDKDGRPHVTAEFDETLLRFDPATEQWEVLGAIPGTLRGIAVDAAGDAWVATNATCGLAHWSVADGSVSTLPLPECNMPVGVSIDIDGYVWVVDQWAGAPPFGRAHKIDPADGAVQLTVMGLDTPYTYSDMTGGGLNLVSFPPQG